MGQATLVQLLEGQEEERKRILESDSVEGIIFRHFTRANGKPNRELEQKALLEYPRDFINAVRSSRVFLHDRASPEYWDALQSYQRSGQEYALHLRVWAKLRAQEGDLWERVLREMKRVWGMRMREVLFFVTVWLEEEKWRTADAQEFVAEGCLDLIYNHFIALYMSGKPKPIGGKVLATQHEELFGVLDRHVQRRGPNPLAPLMRSLSEWHAYYLQVVVLYCFDHTSTVAEAEAGRLVLRQEAEDYRLWKMGTVRHHKLRFDLFVRSGCEVERMEEEEELTICGDAKSQSLIRETCKREGAIDWLMSNLGVAELKKNEQKGYYQKFTSVIVLLSTYWQLYYNAPLEELRADGRTDWLTAMYQLFRQSVLSNTMEKLPWLIESKTSFAEWMRTVRIQDGQDAVPLYQSIFRDLSYDFSREKKPYSRHDVRYDVYGTPYCAIGDGFYFTPTMFLAANDWFVSSYERIVRELGERKLCEQRVWSSREMEGILARAFSDFGFRVKQPTEQEVSEMEGDVDLFVTDEEDTLLVQVKRPYPRISQEEIYYEQQNVDRKARQQLNRAEQYLQREKGIWSLGGRATKWVVSSSYEQIGVVVEGCNKINFFDLLLALERFSVSANGGKTSLRQLIDHLEGDTQLDYVWLLPRRDFTEAYGFPHWMDWVHPSVGDVEIELD